MQPQIIPSVGIAAIVPRSDMKLSSKVTIAKFLELERDRDRNGLARFVWERLSERYIDPLRSIHPKRKSGFLTMAAACLLVETLESFYQGRERTRGASKATFESFFKRSARFSVFQPLLNDSSRTCATGSCTRVNPGAGGGSYGEASCLTTDT